MLNKNYKNVYPKNNKTLIEPSLDNAHSPYKILSNEKELRDYIDGKEIKPTHLRVGLTNKCNLKCNFCNFHSENEKDFYNLFNHADSIKTEDMIQILKEFKDNNGKAATFCGSGECTIHPGYIDICSHANAIGIKIGLITNGSMFSNNKMLHCIANTHTWVRIGINAGSPETYSKITSCNASNFNTILDAVYYLRKNHIKEDFRIGLNFVITLDNCLEICQAAAIAKKAGAHYIRFEPEFYSALAHETIYEKLDEVNQMLIEAQELSDDDFEVSIPKLDRGAMRETECIEGDFNLCHYSNFVTALGADGYIYPCPQVHLSSEHRMGNVIDMGYQNWILSNERKGWKEKNSDRTEKCKSCFYRPQNELLELLTNGSLNLEETLEKFASDFPNTLHKEFV